ncbi:NADH:flavin oxidoreductase/NADH oxidase [Chryseobacterium sp. LC2016-29]|uniref:NADH:flavin oxidoreductase/NADH oxidase n=1 Tax=Chryseobacterium sp. LC2016-29 TaxID=2897331 RepID=UPI001E3E7824|nr:NADH:flavin oxidoreductase/NADH oxidase [Chryseobacterium sp. LC2016-29]MCD0477896.1 NADH:flavin oxidoreductase/NADH oxidase [Chryseobacterium sp. LC2016-29]
MSILFSPVTVKSVTFKNRVLMSPMCMYSSVDGFATDWHLVHYGSRAIGGAGTIMIEAASVRADGRIGIGDLGIYKDEHVEGLQRITGFIKEQGSVPAIQIAHAGRKASNWVSGGESKILFPEDKEGWEIIAPSAIPFSSESQTPREMDVEEIHNIQNSFADAAKRALEAGFELLEIHSAHGYLLNEFLSPITNKRTDGYGGTLENRSRMLFETIEKVKIVWPEDLPIAVRISATDWVDEGWTLEDSMWLSQKLSEAGIDIIDVSTGGAIPNAKIPVGAGYQLPFASAIKKDKDNALVVATVGLIDSAKQAETILANGDADFIVVGRELLRNPYFPLTAAKELRAEIIVPKQYELAIR